MTLVTQMGYDFFGDFGELYNASFASMINCRPLDDGLFHGPLFSGAKKEQLSYGNILQPPP